MTPSSDSDRTDGTEGRRKEHSSFIYSTTRCASIGVGEINERLAPSPRALPLAIIPIRRLAIENIALTFASTRTCAFTLKKAFDRSSSIVELLTVIYTPSME